MKNILTFCILTFSVGSIFGQSSPLIDPVEFVNPLTGTQSKFDLSNGNTYPVIALPWGMNFWTPQTGKSGDGRIYTYDADRIRGFKQTHQPSPWINDYGQFSLMPVTGKPEFDEDKRSGFFSHKAEIAKPYYYKVYLADYDVTTEFTPTQRAVIFRFTFPEGDSFVTVDAFDNGSYVKIISSENKIIGYTTKNSGGVPDNFKNHFVIVFDKPFTYKATFADSVLIRDTDESAGFHSGAVIGFKTAKGETVHARVASSFISPEQAETNLRELSADSFESIKENGKRIWNEVLRKIEVEGGTYEQTRTFYSCLYRSVLFPRSFYEIDNEGRILHYSPYNGEVLHGFLFTDTGFWDTFRCLFPLLNLVYPSMNEKMQAGLVNAYLESGFLPEWASPGHRDCMIGNNSVSIVTDAYLKCLCGYDIDTLYTALIHGSESVHPKISSVGRAGSEYYNKLGYVPYDVNINESAARTLEYSYSDWAIHMLAKKLKRPQSEIDLYGKRALNYRNLFDPSTKLVRGRNKDGSFQSPFNPFKWGDAFTEGNSWHYTWSVFHDVQGLIDLMGGNDCFVRKLDSVFVMPPVFDDSYYGFTIHEIREMQGINMGQYAHGNQPIQHMIYLYSYAGAPWKAQYWSRETMDRLYHSGPDGYCGDEDNGQTSAWYVFSAMGFYPVCPGSDEYVLGSPLFKKVVLNLENGKKAVIDSPNNTSETRYIKSLKVNGKDYSKNYLKYDDFLQGATFEFEMSVEPYLQRGVLQSDFPYSFDADNRKESEKHE